MNKTTPGQTLSMQTLKLYWHAALAHKKDLILSFLLPVGGIFLSVAVPFFASKTLAGILQQKPLKGLLIMLILCSVIGAIANRFGFRYNMRLQARTMSDLGQLVFERLLNRSISFHTNRISGKLVSDAIDFVTSFSMLANVAFINGFTFASVILLGLIVIWASSWQLGLFISAVVIIIITWAIIDSRVRSRLRSQRLVATKQLTSHLSDSIVNAQTVKTFAQEKLEMGRNRELNEKLEHLRLRDWQRAGTSANNRMAVLLTLQFCMMLFIVQLTRVNPAVLAAGIFAFAYTLTLSNRLFEINTIMRQAEECFLQASPMTAMLREAIEIQDRPNAINLKVARGEIAIRDVSFAYPDNAQNGAVFKNFNLTVKPGEKIGLVGPSGGGKSTLTRLLLRFDEVKRGEILIDSQNINHVTQASLRTKIAYVPQEPLLFHRSIRENIAYGRPSANQTAIEKAAKRANADGFIRSLPEGYDTVVGERGVKLSGGQRQRVAIARAILKDAPILILDEATSALDSENELQVQEALWHLMQGRTALVIAHRLSTIQKMDRIVVMDNGKMIEEGTHQSLLKTNGTYARLWKHQSGGFIED